jgi:hypothetical protein
MAVYLLDLDLGGETLGIILITVLIMADGATLTIHGVLTLIMTVSAMDMVADMVTVTDIIQA